MTSDKEFLDFLDKYDYNPKIGQIVRGTIISYDTNGVIVDIKTKNDAFCPLNEIIINNDEKNINKILKIGEEYDFIITSFDEKNEIFYISNKKLQNLKNIEYLKEKYKNKEILTGKVVNTGTAGLIIDINGIKGFMPISQLVDKVQMGYDVKFKILSFDENNNFIFSNKSLYEKDIQALKKEILDKIEVNMVVKGVVTKITDFGAFVDIGGLEGLLPLSQMSWKWIKHPSCVLNLQDKIDVEIISIDREKQRITLSLKSLIDNPWNKINNIIHVGDIIKGKVVSKMPFGLFIEIYPDIEGLLTKNFMEKFTKKYNHEFNIGDEIEVVVQSADFKNQKIHLKVSKEYRL